MKSLAITLVLGVTLPLMAAQNLTLNDAISMAKKNNLTIKAQNERITQKTYDERTSKGNYLPTVTLSGQYTLIDRDIEINLDGIREAMLQLDSKTNARITLDSMGIKNNKEMQDVIAKKYYDAYNGMVDHFVSTVKEQNYPSAQLLVTQPIYAGGKITAGKKAASADLRATKAETSKISNETIQQVYTQYFGIALLEKTVAVRRDVISGMSQHLNMAQKLVAAGAISRNNLLRAQVATADADRAYIEDSCKLILAQASFANLVGLEEQEFTVDDSLIIPQTGHNLDSLTEIANSSQPILEMIRSKRSAAEAKVQAERSGFIPKIGAFGKVELFQDYLSSLDPKWAVGLNASMDIFSGTKTLNRTISAKHLIAECDINEKSAKQSIRLWIRKSQLDLESAQARNSRCIAEIELGMENLRQVESRFQNGLGTSVDVIDAQLSLAKSKTDQLVTQYDKAKAIMDLYTALGKSNDLCSLYSK